ncbi:helix-turn-helix transcriptional regulator [Escherichia coli]|uniref:helix-turn-helix transcriptional regulator n=1 Tax=Escherichia coli TaxID=562 RepID=UPI003C6DAF99
MHQITPDFAVKVAGDGFHCGFPKPIKLGRSSRWYKSEVEQWMQQRIEESRGAAA